MRINIYRVLAVGLLIMLCTTTAKSGERTSPLIIDHNCTELSAIPLDWIDLVQENRKWHYGRTSHGRQVNAGLARIEDADATYSMEASYYGGYLPDVPGALCIYTSVDEPYDYWQGASGMDATRAVLDGTPALNVSAWCWCTQLNTYQEASVNGYLDAMNTLESEYPDVTFVYFTGTAEYDGWYGYNRHLRNEQIRQFCNENNKVLYDFADLDSWWFNPSTEEWEHSTYEYEGNTIPVEHPELAGSEINHTTYESCEQKAKALWWLMARLEGWGGTLDVAITSFTTECKDGAIILRWSVSITSPFDGFNIYRSEDGGTVFSRINSELIPAGISDEYVDRNVIPGKTYTYRIVAVDGENEYSSHTISVTSMPASFRLNQNYPNPFNPSTTISFSLDGSQPFTLNIYDVQGKMIKTLLSGVKEAGEHSINWNGTNSIGNPVDSGVYYYSLECGKRVETRKMLLLR